MEKVNDSLDSEISCYERQIHFLKQQLEIYMTQISSTLLFTPTGAPVTTDEEYNTLVSRLLEAKILLLKKDNELKIKDYEKYQANLYYGLKLKLEREVKKEKRIRKINGQIERYNEKKREQILMLQKRGISTPEINLRYGVMKNNKPLNRFINKKTPFNQPKYMTKKVKRDLINRKRNIVNDENDLDFSEFMTNNNSSSFNF